MFPVCFCATDSFWEGVDIPGDSLKGCYKYAVCPFRVPTDPISEGEDGKNKNLRGEILFWNCCFPRQPCAFIRDSGVLCAGKANRGAVFILDPRIVRKSYGKILLSSIPESAVSY